MNRRVTVATLSLIDSSVHSNLVSCPTAFLIFFIQRSLVTSNCQARGGFLSLSPLSSQNRWTPDQPLLELTLAPHFQPFFSWFFLMLLNGGMSPMFCFLPILFSWNSLVWQIGLLLFLLTRANIYWVRRVERVKHITLTRTLGGWWCYNPILQLKKSRQKAVEELGQDHSWQGVELDEASASP